MMSNEIETIPYDKKKHDAGGYKAFSYVVVWFLDDNNKPLSQLPFRLKCSGYSGTTFLKHYSYYNVTDSFCNQFLATYKSLTGDRALDKNEVFYAHAVFQPTFIRKKVTSSLNHQSSFAVITNGFLEPTASNFASMIIKNVGLGLGSNPGAITVNGNGNEVVSGSNFSPTDLGNTESGLSSTPGKTLALIGSEVNFAGGIVTAEGGKIEISSLKSGSVGLQKTENGLAFTYNDDAVSYQDINLSEQALINTSGEGQGAISLTGKNILLSNGSFILNQNRGNIDFGAIEINAIETLRLSGTSTNGEIPSSIRSQSLSRGQGGMIEINTKHLSVLDKGRISATTYSEAGGINLKVNAIDSVEIVDSNLNVSTFAKGNAGNLELITSDLQITDSGAVTSSTFGTGNAGKIDVQAKSINIAGASASDRSNISATSFSSGNAGSVNIDTEQLKVENGASVSSSALAGGNAGSVVINASKSAEVEGINQNFKGLTPESTIRSAVIAAPPAAREAFKLPPIPTGNAGNLTINTPELHVLKKGVISVENQGTGSAGTLSINAKQVNLSEGGSITAASASGEGGNIAIASESLQIDIDSQISATAENNGDGGNITINTSNLSAKKNSDITTSAIDGNGGNIAIASEVLSALENSDITANAIGGNGGNIVIDSDFIFGSQGQPELTPFSDITASSELGIDGQVNINTLDTNIEDQLVISAKETNLVQTELDESTCINKYGEKVQFIDLGDAKPESPYYPLYDSEDELVDTNLASTTEVNSQELVEANQVKTLPNGDQYLIAAPVTQIQSNGLCVSN